MGGVLIRHTFKSTKVIKLVLKGEKVYAVRLADL